MKIIGRVMNQKLEIGEFNRAALHDFLHAKENQGKRIVIEDRVPESRQQRAWFEGALVPLVTFYQEGMDHKESEDNRKVREWLMQEFNSEGITINGKYHLVKQTSKSKLNDLIERIMDWMTENGYQTELLVPKEYEKWRDEIFPFGGPETYIDYLVSINRLRALEKGV